MAITVTRSTLLARPAQSCRSGRVDATRGSEHSGAMSVLHDLIAEHGAASFPENVVKGNDYGEVDAVMIGADIYGWALQSNTCNLTSIDRARLHAARDALGRSLAAFPDEARPYYEQLVALADAALA